MQGTGHHNNHKGGKNGGRGPDSVCSATDLLTEIKQWCANGKLVRDEYRTAKGKLKREKYGQRIAVLKDWSYNTNSKRDVIKKAIELQTQEVSVLQQLTVAT
jgi:hypothetical protein